MYRIETGVIAIAVITLIVTAFVAVGVAAPARAADDKTVCVDQNASHDDAIAACGRLMDGGKYKGNDLAVLYRGRGSHLLHKHALDRAMADLDVAIRLNPKLAAAYSARCWAWHDKGDADKALADCNQALQLDAKMWGAYVNRGNAYALKKDYDHAISDYDQAAQLQPTNALVFELRGDAYVAKGDNDRAITDYSEAIRLDPKSSVAFNRRGNAYYRKGMWDLAIADYSEAMRLDPKESIFVKNRGWAALQKGDNDRALADLDEAVRLDQNSDSYLNDRGQIWMTIGNYDRAIADFDKAIRLNPKNNSAFAKRGFAYFFKGDFDRALADEAESQRLNPQNAGLFNIRCLLLTRKGNLDAAMADCDQALRLAPKSATAFGNRCGARLAKGDLDAAVADCEQAIAIDPGYTGGYVNRGLVFERQGDRARAVADFRMALAKPPKYLTGKSDQDTAREHLAALGVASQAPASAAPPNIPPVAAEPGRRVALVIGNSAYRSVARLDNPVNDAKLMAETLRGLGFTLVGDGAQLDLDKSAFDNAVQKFGNELQGADVGLFYYAGHGLQLRGTNYLVPVNANPTREADVDFQMVDTAVVLRQMEASGTKLNVVMLDACRNNPFGGRALRASSGGLAQMQAPEGTLVSYATQPGNVAQDGLDGDSPYTKALADTIRKPGLDIFQTFNEVGLAVKRATGGAQQPWVSSSPIEGTFYFVAK